MKWQEIRQQYPRQWLLVEAVKAHSEANKRILEQLAVIGAFPDSITAMNHYAQLHRDAPQRELYVFHTSRRTLDITERRWLGVWGKQTMVYPLTLLQTQDD
jgi:hypothetical protein